MDVAGPMLLAALAEWIGIAAFVACFIAMRAVATWMGYADFFRCFELLFCLIAAIIAVAIRATKECLLYRRPALPPAPRWMTIAIAITIVIAFGWAIFDGLGNLRQ